MFSPCFHGLSHALFEGEVEGTVTSVAAVVSHFLDSEGVVGSYSFTIETDEMIDAEIVDICVIIHLFTGEILAEIETVCANRFSKLKRFKSCCR